MSLTAEVRKTRHRGNELCKFECSTAISGSGAGEALQKSIHQGGEKKGIDGAEPMISY